MPLDRDLPKSTRFASLNLAWQFNQRAILDIEYLWGRNIMLVDTRGAGHRGSDAALQPQPLL